MTPATLKDGVIRILHVEDHEPDAALVRALLGSWQDRFTLKRAGTLDEALSIATDWTPDVVLLDLHVPDSSGIDTFRKARRRFQNASIIVLTGLDDPDVAAKLASEGASAFLSKSHVDWNSLPSTLAASILGRKSLGPHPEDASELERLLDMIQDGIIVVDATGLVRLANPTARRMLGLDENEVLGFPIGRPATDGGPTEITLQRKDGQNLDVELRAIDVRNTPGRYKVLMLRDLTTARRARLAAAAAEVNRDFVQELIRELRQSDHQRHHLRTMGRTLGQRAHGATLQDRLETLAAMGLGEVHLLETQGRRHQFAGINLIDLRHDSRGVGCDLTLGFLEGTVQTLTGRPALGAETECQGMGARRCLFTISSAE